jgi:hypothetical protein
VKSKPSTNDQALGSKISLTLGLFALGSFALCSLTPATIGALRAVRAQGNSRQTCSWGGVTTV